MSQRLKEQVVGGEPDAASGVFGRYHIFWLDTRGT